LWCRNILSCVCPRCRVGSHNGAYEKLLFGKLQDAGALGAKGDDLTVAVVNGIAEMKFCLLSGECVLNVRGVIK